MGIRVIGSTERVRCLAQITQRGGQRTPFPDSESPAIFRRFEKKKMPPDPPRGVGNKAGAERPAGLCGGVAGPTRRLLLPGNSGAARLRACPVNSPSVSAGLDRRRASRFCEPPKGGAGSRAGPVPGTP